MIIFKISVKYPVWDIVTDLIYDYVDFSLTPFYKILRQGGIIGSITDLIKNSISLNI